MKGYMKKFFQRDWKKNKFALVGGIIAGAAALFLVWEAFFGFSPANVKVLDARVTFKFTAYQDKEQHFASYVLENKTKAKVKATVRVQLGKASLGGRVFHSIRAENNFAELDPLETKSFAVQMDIPKSGNGKEQNFDVRAKVKRVSRA